jgi:predicted Fe-S protein YdhL (DUF1289 family)
MGKTIDNPCVRRCYDYDFTEDYCRGCGITLEERQKWFLLPTEDRQKILDRIAKSRRTGTPAKTGTGV